MIYAKANAKKPFFAELDGVKLKLVKSLPVQAVEDVRIVKNTAIENNPLDKPGRVFIFDRDGMAPASGRGAVE